MGKVLFQASDCSSYAKYGSRPKNINLPVTKTEHIIPCIERVPISQETGTLLQILCCECPQHPFQRCCLCSSWQFSQNRFSLVLYSLPLLTSFLTSRFFSDFFKTFSLSFFMFHTVMYMCECVSMYVCAICVYMSVCVNLCMNVCVCMCKNMATCWKSL